MYFLEESYEKMQKKKIKFWKFWERPYSDSPQKQTNKQTTKAKQKKEWLPF